MTIAEALVILHQVMNIANRAQLANGADSLKHSALLIDAEATIVAALTPPTTETSDATEPAGSD